ncbi:hypothetical protein FLAVO9AF_190050 [Flavobacterium sp. 9AF]|nr:hypothetical protein FLAVO9AF_190050 [Flavobacterium sp. 9AF]
MDSLFSVFNQSFILRTFLNISSIKHHLVKEDCNKLAPTKIVNQSQF